MSPCLHEKSGIGAVVKVADFHLCGWGSIPGKTCSFLIVSLSKSLSLCFMCSDQLVKYWMPRGFPLTSSLLLNYQYIHTQKRRKHTHLPRRRQVKVRRGIAASTRRQGRTVTLFSDAVTAAV